MGEKGEKAMLAEIQRIIKSRVPSALPVGQGPICYPNLNNPAALVSGAANVYGNNVQVLAAGGNLTGVWVVGIYGCIFNTATLDYSICVSADAAGAPPVTVLGEVPFQTQTTVVGDHHEFIPFYKPVFIPANTLICLASADGGGAGTCAAYAVCVLNL
jgi:hypothetical protein